MPVKKDPSGKRSVELEFVVPGTPEQVWAAMATGPGNSAWFTQTAIEEHVGGKVSFGFGDGVSSSGTVTTWEPPRRFGYEERNWNGEAPPLATEIVIEARAGGRCVVRLVHSLFSSSDEWDDQMEGFEKGWAGCIEVLRVYLAHFAGQKATSVRAMRATAGDRAAAWKLLGEKLDFSGANVGDVYAAPAGAPPLAGTVELIRQSAEVREIMLRLTEPRAGVALLGVHAQEGSTYASVSLFLYGDEAPMPESEVEPQWREWMASTFPAQAG